MLGFWAEFMPLFIVRWLAKRYCEELHIAGCGHCSHVRMAVCTARSDTLLFKARLEDSYCNVNPPSPQNKPPFPPSSEAKGSK